LVIKKTVYVHMCSMKYDTTIYMQLILCNA
jgi:hypothetical protein